VTYEIDEPAGKTFKMNAFGGGVSNSVPVNDKLSITPSLDATSTTYGQTTAPQRKDTLLSARLAGNYALDAKWSLSGDVGYTRSGSTVPASYEYKRFVISAGASYLF
jgi:hypothetical protein